MAKDFFSLSRVGSGYNHYPDNGLDIRPHRPYNRLVVYRLQRCVSLSSQVLIGQRLLPNGLVLARDNNGVRQRNPAHSANCKECFTASY